MGLFRIKREVNHHYLPDNNLIFKVVVFLDNRKKEGHLIQAGLPEEKCSQDNSSVLQAQEEDENEFNEFQQYIETKRQE